MSFVIICPPAAVGLSAGKRVPGSKHDDAASFDCVCSAVPDSSPKVGPAPIPGQHKEQQPAGGTPGLLGNQHLSSTAEADMISVRVPDEDRITPDLATPRTIWFWHPSGCHIGTSWGLSPQWVVWQQSLDQESCSLTGLLEHACCCRWALQSPECTGELAHLGDSTLGTGATSTMSSL